MNHGPTRSLSALQDHARRGICSAIVFYRGPSDTPVVRSIEPQGVVVYPFATLIRAWQREPVDGTRTFTLSRILEVRPSPLLRRSPAEPFLAPPTVAGEPAPQLSPAEAEYVDLLLGALADGETSARMDEVLEADPLRASLAVPRALALRQIVLAHRPGPTATHGRIVGGGSTRIASSRVPLDGPWGIA